MDVYKRFDPACTKSFDSVHLSHTMSRLMPRVYTSIDSEILCALSKRYR